MSNQVQSYLIHRKQGENGNGFKMARVLYFLAKKKELRLNFVTESSLTVGHKYYFVTMSEGNTFSYSSPAVCQPIYRQMRLSCYAFQHKLYQLYQNLSIVSFEGWSLHTPSSNYPLCTTGTIHSVLLYLGRHSLT